MTTKEIVIIGAGPGGLASAMLLRKAGANVTVLEREGRVGGRTSTLRQDGFTFDTGPTFFLYPPVLEEIFENCGYKLSDHVDLIRLDPHYKLHFEKDGHMVARPSEKAMEEEISRIAGEKDGKNFSAYMEQNRRKFSSFTPVLQNAFSSVLDLCNLDMVKMLPYFKPTLSVEGDLKNYFSDERIRLACAFQSKYLGMSPFTCPSIFTILSFLEYEYGIFHPKGGCGAVSQAMADVAEKMGVDIRLSHKVTNIEFSGKRAVAANVGSQRFPCDALVINADFAHSMRTLVPDSLRKKWTDKRLDKKKYSCSTFMIYLGVAKEFPELEHHNIFLSEEYKKNLSDIEYDHVLSENPSFYVCNPVKTDPGMAPEGQSALYILVPVSHLHDNIDWAAEKNRYRDLTLKQLKKVGIEIYQEDILVEKVLPPSEWATDWGIHKGAVFNLAHSLDQMLFLRPQNRFSELDGVYLVGGGTHPGSGLPVIYESSRISSDLIIKDLKL